MNKLKVYYNIKAPNIAFAFVRDEDTLGTIHRMDNVQGETDPELQLTAILEALKCVQPGMTVTVCSRHEWIANWLNEKVRKNGGKNPELKKLINGEIQRIGSVDAEFLRSDGSMNYALEKTLKSGGLQVNEKVEIKEIESLEKSMVSTTDTKACEPIAMQVLASGDGARVAKIFPSGKLKEKLEEIIASGKNVIMVDCEKVGANAAKGGGGEATLGFCSWRGVRVFKNDKGEWFKEQVFSNPVDRGMPELNGKQVRYEKGHNNFGEYAALMEGVMYMESKYGKEWAVYTDSKTARSWGKNMEVNTTFNRSDLGKAFNEEVKRLEGEFSKNRKPEGSHNKNIILWETGLWGENPADFGN